MFYFAVFASGLLLTVLFVYPVKRLAYAWGAVAAPGGRSIHSSLMPLMGGLAIYLACVFIGLLLLGWNHWEVSSLHISWAKLMGLFLGATFLLFVGIIDDIKALRVRWKLLGQLIAIAIPVLFGYTIEAIQLPFLGSIQLGSLGPVLFALWVLGITNAVNLTDGLDGLASVVCFFAAIGNGIIALTMGNVFIAFFSFMLAGCLLGFLFHNFPPARIFLGDTGSMLLGFLLAVAVIESNTQKRTTTLLILAPLLLLGFSLLDVVLSIFRRFLRGKPIFSSDLGHIHHRLMIRFRNPRRVLLVVACFSIFMVVVSLITHFGKFIPPLIFAFLLFATGLITVLFVRLLGYFRADRIRYALENREEVKFFSALLSYLRDSLPKVKTQQSLIQELDWVCQAMKPHSVRVIDSHQEVIYCYTNPVEKQESANSYKEKLKGDNLTLEWSHATMSEQPSTCDIRLMWRDLFGLFAQHWHRFILGREKSATLQHSSQDEMDDIFQTKAPETPQAPLPHGLSSGTQVLDS